MAGTVTQIQSSDGSAGAAVVAFDWHLYRVALAANTAVAYRRQVGAYVAWLHAHLGEHPDAFTDLIGAEAAVTAWPVPCSPAHPTAPRWPGRRSTRPSPRWRCSTSTAPGCGSRSSGSASNAPGNPPR